MKERRNREGGEHGLTRGQPLSRPPSNQINRDCLSEAKPVVPMPHLCCVQGLVQELNLKAWIFVFQFPAPLESKYSVV
mgnify:CR=1 FL=1